MTRIKGDMDTPYSDFTTEHLTSKEFLDRNQPLYVQRHNFDPACGDKVKLEESIGRLQERDLIGKHPDLFFCWCKKDTGTVGRTSVLMKAVAMNLRLDGPLVSEQLLDYCVYSQLLMVDRGFSGAAPDKDGYIKKLKEYPGSKTFDKQLKQMGLHV